MEFKQELKKYQQIVNQELGQKWHIVKVVLPNAYVRHI